MEIEQIKYNEDKNVNSIYITISQLFFSFLTDLEFINILLIYYLFVHTVFAI